MGEEENWRTVSLFVRLEDSATEGRDCQGPCGYNFPVDTERKGLIHY